MTIDGDAAYQVLLARDARFDGRLFVGVTSTGIYCRPICRVRTPSRRNCRFFDTPAQAEAEAFRPCLKCRPEIAPGPGLAWSVMDASRTLARQAASLLDNGLAHGFEHGVGNHAEPGEAAGPATTTMAGLSNRLGVSDRHLRRIFFAEHGVTPIQYLQTRRLLLAKQLLTDTRMPVSEIALASGFRSLRRFNAAFADGYRMNPTRLRRAATTRHDGAVSDGSAAARDGSDGQAITVTLGYRAPHDHAALLAFLSARAIPGIETVDGLTVRRSLRAGAIPVAMADDTGAGPTGSAGWLEARFAPAASKVHLSFSPSLGPCSGAVIAAARRWLDLDASPATIDAALADLPGEPGLRLPGSVDGFELAVRAVLGQQVTVAAARTLAGRLVERFGDAAGTPWQGIHRSFPSPQALATAPVERIAELGIIRSRAGAIQALAGAWHGLQPLLDPGAAAEPLVERLRALPGIGDWTAHYIAMRALGWTDAFPHGDVAALKAMRHLFGTVSARAADMHAAVWKPWRSYALLRLWQSLALPVPAPAHPLAAPATPLAGSGRTRRSTGVSP